MIIPILVLLGLSTAQQYRLHKTPINYEVPHELIFGDQRCWSNIKGSEMVVPSNCTANYCSRCYYNKNIVDYRTKYMSYNDNRLVVGAMDTFLAFDATDNRFEKIDQLKTISIQKRASCLGDQYRKDASCRNYNRVMLSLDPGDGSLLTCGTNFYNYNGACQIRKVNKLEPSDLLDGTGVVSQNEGAWSTAFMSDSRIFAGSMVAPDASSNFFVIMSAKIGKKEGKDGFFKGFTNVVLTTQDWLNRAKFVASFDNGDYAYFFFQEIEYTALIAGDDKNVVVSRIARVCKEDAGVDVGLGYLGVKDYRLQWRTFVKAEIYCENKVEDSTFGTQAFKYKRIGDAVLDTSTGKRTLYASFSAGDTSASGSVVCSYDLDTIDEGFNSDYYKQPTETPIQERARKPPTCKDMEKTTNTDRELLLRSKAVTSEEAPLFLQSGMVFTKLLLDTNIRNTSDTSSYPVLFIGTNTGNVLKVAWYDTKDGDRQAILVESLQIAIGETDSDLSIRFLVFEKTNDPSYLFVGSGVSVSKVIISRCLRIPTLSQMCCYASRDPYCGWCPSGNICTSRSSCGSSWIPAISADVTDSCPGEIHPQPATPTAVPVPEHSTTPPPPASLPPAVVNVTTTAAAGSEGQQKVVTIPTPVTNVVDPKEQQVKEKTEKWRTVAIVMAILCSVFGVISVILGLNLLRRWCSGSKKQSPSNTNNKGTYNPLSANANDYPARIPVFQQNNKV